MYLQIRWVEKCHVLNKSPNIINKRAKQQVPARLLRLNFSLPTQVISQEPGAEPNAQVILICSLQLAGRCEMR